MKKNHNPEQSGAAHAPLPHENDQLHGQPDGQTPTPHGPRDEMRQAYEDIESGQQDTDRYGQGGLEKPQQQSPGGASSP